MPVGTGACAVRIGPAGGIEADALAALGGLGFRRSRGASGGARMRSSVWAPDARLDAVIRDSLKELAR